MTPVLWKFVHVALIHWLPERCRTATLGDLREDYDRQRAARGKWRAEMWLLRETLSLIVAYRAERRTGARPGSMAERLWRDVRDAARGLGRTPGFSGVALLTLALGIGSTTATFTVVYGVLLKPLPFHEPERLVALYHTMPGWGPRTDGPQGDATYFTYRDHGRVFEDIGLWNSDDVSTVRNGEPEQVQVLRVTDGTLPLLGVRPALGRLITREDDVPGAPLRVLLTHGYWQRAFGAAPDVVGQSLLINARPHEIIGVLPAGFKLLNTNPDLVVAFRLNRANTFTGFFAPGGVARLKPNVTLAEANDDIRRMIPLIVEKFPLMPGITREMWDQVGLAPNVRPLAEAVIGEMNRPLWILLGVIGFVLVMAWTNVANLQLVRAEGRQRELAIRAALGASRGRIAAGLLVESLMLGVTGGALGVLFAMSGIGLLRRMAPAALPRVDEIGIDGVVLLATLTTSVVTALVFGLIPVLRVRTSNPGVLSDANRSCTDAPGRHRTRNVLAVTQIALALLLLVVSGLMVRTFVALRQVQPGYARPAEVLTFGAALPPALVRPREQVVHTYEQMAERLKHVPGVVSVGLANMIAMDGIGGAPIFVEDRPVTGTPPLRRIKAMAPGYLETMGTPLVAGRAITWTDIRQLARVVWVSENFAREYWGEPAKALGKRVAGAPGDWLEIAGVVGDVREAGLNQSAPPLLYFPMADRQFVSRAMTFVVRSNRVGNAGFLRELQHAVWSVNKNVPLAKVRTMEAIQAASMAQTSFAMVMLAIAASGALLLALVGIYGVVSHIVTERTREVGIRIALGATGGDVRRLFLRYGLALTMVGVVLGTTASMLVGPVVSALLYGVSPTDPITYAGVTIVLGAVTILATYLPARRATLVDPAAALRT